MGNVSSSFNGKVDLSRNQELMSPMLVYKFVGDNGCPSVSLIVDASRSYKLQPKFDRNCFVEGTQAYPVGNP